VVVLDANAVTRYVVRPDPVDVDAPAVRLDMFRRVVETHYWTPA